MLGSFGVDLPPLVGLPELDVVDGAVDDHVGLESGVFTEHGRDSDATLTVRTDFEGAGPPHARHVALRLTSASFLEHVDGPALDLHGCPPCPAAIPTLHEEHTR